MNPSNGLCGDCGKPVVRAVDEKYGTEKVLEEVHKSGQFLVQGKTAVFWGPTGGTHRVHRCTPTSEFVPLFAIDPDIPDPSELGHGQPLRKRRPASAEKVRRAKRIKEGMGE